MTEEQIPVTGHTTPTAHERRGRARVPASVPIRITDADNQSTLGEVVDLSLDGLTFCTERRIEPDAECRAELQLTHNGEPVACGLRLSVVWCDAGSAPDCFWVGCCIVELPFITKALLEQMLSD